MEAVSRGAHEIGGRVVGVTVAPWLGRLAPNPYLSEERSAQTLFERLEALVESDGLIALPGGAGTLGEVALAWNLRQTELMPAKPVILVGEEWRRLAEAFARCLIIDEDDLALLRIVPNVEVAVEELHSPDQSIGR
jgi:predicted Rossmann-fold nucleotide-binding protein